MNKEEIYDTQISPLVKQIIEIVEKHGIAMIASFAIGHDGKGPEGQDCTRLTCSTIRPDGDGNPDDRFMRAIGIIQDNPYVAMLTVATKAGAN